MIFIVNMWTKNQKNGEALCCEQRIIHLVKPFDKNLILIIPSLIFAVSCCEKWKEKKWKEKGSNGCGAKDLVVCITKGEGELFVLG